MEVATPSQRTPAPDSPRLPSGSTLPQATWQRRHRGVLWLLGLHAVGLAIFGLYVGAEPVHAILEGGLVALIGLVAAYPRFGRRFRSVIAAWGLMTCSAALTHLSGGYIEAHFHFFVMLGVIFLYEDWLPYFLAVAYVALHHGIAGTLDPLSVYNHPSAISAPWQWAGIHALFIMGLSGALLVGWNVIEHARRAETRAVAQTQDLKRQLLSQEKMAALGSLVSGLAHEVRTPLTVVSSSASLLELAAERDPENVLSPRVRLHANDIHASVDRINALVLQLRKFHQLAADDMQVAPLDDIVREAMRLFSSVDHSGRNVQLALAPMPATSLHPLGVHQVVLNLVNNAIEATRAPDGSVRVETRAEDRHVLLIVADNGEGMDHETQRKLFEPLFTTKPDGMGLGLHIVKRIMDAHGGTIEFSSRAGRGTTFEVRFPVATAAANQEPPAARAASTAPTPA